MPAPVALGPSGPGEAAHVQPSRIFFFPHAPYLLFFFVWRVSHVTVWGEQRFLSPEVALKALTANAGLKTQLLVEGGSENRLAGSLSGGAPRLL